MRGQLIDFLTESNRIEGIIAKPTDRDVHEALVFLALEKLELANLKQIQWSIASGKPIRDKSGMNVRVGDYVAPPGGPAIVEHVENLLLVMQVRDSDPWVSHCVFEQIHPFLDGNGRTGRLLWAWQMLRNGTDPFALPFLHRFYYQTLSSVQAQLMADAPWATELASKKGAR